jgi:hypothetical protein
MRHFLFAKAAATLVIALVAAGATSSAAFAGSVRQDREPSNSSSTSTACWQQADSTRSVCAETFEALGAAVFDKYGLVVAGEPAGINADQAELAASSHRESLQAARAGIRVNQKTTWLMGTVYMDRNYSGGNSLTTTAPPDLTTDPCLRGADLNFGWVHFYWGQIRNDNAESVATASKCKVRMWADDFSGTTTGWVGSRPDLLGFRNEASSWEYEGGH